MSIKSFGRKIAIGLFILTIGASAAPTTGDTMVVSGTVKDSAGVAVA